MLPAPRAFAGSQVATETSVRIARPRSTLKILPASLVCLCLLSGGRSLQAQSDQKENSPQPAVESAKDVLQRMRDSFARIRSIHYTFESTHYSRGPVRTHAWTSKTDGELALANGKFYSSFNGTTTRDNGSKWSGATAFDGSKYQRYDSNNSLTVSSKMTDRSPYGSHQPVMHPFLFAYTRPGPITFEEISKQESWDELGNRAKLEPSEIVKGHPCDVVSFAKESEAIPKSEVFWKIYAARDLGYYPVRQITAYRNTRTVLDVTEWKVVPTAMGDVVIPIKITLESRDDGGVLLSSHSHAVRLLSVNEEVPDSLFSLMRFNPEKVKYLD